MIPAPTDDDRIARIRAHGRANGLSARRLAIAANVEIGEVLGIYSPEWEPSADTLAALDRIIPVNAAATAPNIAGAAPVVNGPRLHNREAGSTMNRTHDHTRARPGRFRGEP